MNKKLIFLLSFVFALSITSPLKANEYGNIKIISSVKSFQKNKPFDIAVVQTLKNGWHTYWKNPGDAGYATSFNWSLPKGIKIKEKHFPTPEIINYASLTDYGYKDRVTYLFEVIPSENFNNNELKIKLNASWLVCKGECIPQEKNIVKKIKSSTKQIKNNEQIPLFEKALKKIPKDTSSKSIFKTDSEHIYIKLENKNLEKPYFFPISDEIIVHSAKQEQIKAKNSTILKIKKAPFAPEFNKIEGIIKSNQGDLYIKAKQKNFNILNKIKLYNKSLIYYIMIAFIGGIVLNLMPCVLPVLSLKALDIVKNKDKSPFEHKLHGIFYTLGIIVAFVSFAVLIIGFRSTGEKIGWGFQLQSPIFVMIMTCLMFLIALSLSGLLEVSSKFANIGSSLTLKSGYKQSFFTGLLASVVASPCTAPFMGIALGFALTQTNIVTIIVFISLGLGLAFPYLLLSFIPAFYKMIPRAGAWMDTFKKVLSIPLYISVIWLLWVLEKQKDIKIVLLTVFILLLIFVVSLIKKETLRKAISIFTAIMLVFSLIYAKNTKKALIKNNFSMKKVEQMLFEEKPVFINFTASWCLTCIANKSVLKSEKFTNLLEKHKINYITADWTNKNKDISTMLEKLGRDGIPLYVLYPKGNLHKAVIFPQLLTKKNLIKKLDDTMKNIMINN